jgi:hypothetical protein
VCDCDFWEGNGTCGHGSIREAALARVTHQQDLATIIHNSRDSDIRMTALARVTDQNLLANIAGGYAANTSDIAKETRQSSETIRAKDLNIRMTALARVTEQNLLAEIARKGAYSEVCKSAIEQVTDQTLMPNIAISGQKTDIRVAAIERVTDQRILATIARNGNDDSKVRMAAVKRLDPALNEELIRTIGASIQSVETETNSVVLSEIAKLRASSSLSVLATSAKTR